MATVDCSIAATPAEVFAVLANGWFYSNWVVGTSHMRAVEAEWPERGSRLFHATGVWPVVVRDESVVEQADPARTHVRCGGARFSVANGCGRRMAPCDPKNEAS